MIKPFIGDYSITQLFNDPCCRTNYAKFGLLGHNGLDFGCPTSTEIIATHSGTVKECGSDPSGYGLYIKIENDIEGSIYAHLANQFVVVGQQVRQGDHIGNSNNTGNSTAAHLHFGYYRIPRDRSNGFAGYIDPTPYFGPPGILTPSPVSSNTEDVITDQTKINLGSELGELEVQQIRSAILDARRDVEALQKENESLKDQIKSLTTQLNAPTSPANLPDVPNTTSSILDAIVAWFKKHFS